MIILDVLILGGGKMRIIYDHLKITFLAGSGGGNRSGILYVIRIGRLIAIDAVNRESWPATKNPSNIK